MRLETRAVSAVELPIKDTVDLSDLRVVLVEERRFNIYEHDVSYQYYVLTKLGYDVQKVCLVHIDTSYVRHGELELDKLFTDTE